MIATRQSPSKKVNPGLHAAARRRGENNLRWLARNLKSRSHWETLVLLFGGCDLTAFRVRAAQAHARRDLLPSFWSHVALLSRQGTGTQDWILWEVSLQPAAGFGAIPKENGIQSGALSTYQDAKVFPNIACLQFALGDADIDAAVADIRAARPSSDLPELVIEWLGYCWGVGDRANPLLKGVGVPSAVFVEGVFARAGLEITPGLASQSSCPEVIWQAARWWHRFYESEAVTVQAAPQGFYVIGQPAAAVLIE